MTRTTSADVDLRAFRWRLAPLERKLAHALQSAQLELAALQRQAAAVQDEVQQLRRQQVVQAAAARGQAQRLDPRSHAQVLQYLVHLQAQLTLRSGQASTLAGQIAAARTACVGLDRQAARVQAVRDKLMDRFAARQLRGTAKDADLAWLAQRQLQRPISAAKGSRP